MARVAFKLALKPGNEEIYKQKHDEIWPELIQLFRDFGISNYSIFRHGTELFGYLEVEDPQRLEDLPKEPVMRRWWDMMEPYMEYNENHTPKQINLIEVFHLD